MQTNSSQKEGSIQGEDANAIFKTDRGVKYSRVQMPYFGEAALCAYFGVRRRRAPSGCACAVRLR
eukprot:6160505-Pleurochrysis_carterae.AAC.1